jgi:hypothetical protein
VTTDKSAPSIPKPRRRWLQFSQGTLIAGCLLAWLAVSVGPSGAAEETQETTIARLEFRIADVQPNATPVRAFRYHYELHSAARTKPLSHDRLACQSPDGILRILEPVPLFGRIRVWVDADDREYGYRFGYGSFSYRLGVEKSVELPAISLKLGLVLTGQVLDAETGKPIAGAEVAPLKMGQGYWADWQESAKTDHEGKYRLTATSANGIAARHSDYREDQLQNPTWAFAPGHNVTKKHEWAEQEPAPDLKAGPDGFVLRLQPLICLRGRLVAPDGKPIPGVTIFGFGESDAEGRFRVNVTRQERKQREDLKIDFSSTKYRNAPTPLKDFWEDRELVITLHPQTQTRIAGRILGEDGKPQADCKIEVKGEARRVKGGPPIMVKSWFDTIPGPDSEGKWEHYIDDYEQDLTLQVSVAGTIRSWRQYTREQMTQGAVSTRLGEGCRLTGRLVARVPLDDTNTPVVLLYKGTTEGPLRGAPVEADGRFTFFDLTDGSYVLRLCPANSTHVYRVWSNEPMTPSWSDFAVPDNPWEKPVRIAGRDVALDPIDLHEARLLPGRLTGVAHHPAGDHRPLANAFGCLHTHEHDFDTAGGAYFRLYSMTDAEGRFRLDHCPPGKYVLALSARGYGAADWLAWIRVSPEQTLDLRLFAPEDDHRLTIQFAVGDGSSRDLHAGAGLDAAVRAKHVDPSTGELPYLEDEDQRLRALPSEIAFDLKPLDETTTHWPICHERFSFSPRNLLQAGPGHEVLANLTPGRWRLTLSASYGGLLRAEEGTFLTRDFVFTRGMAPLRLEFPAAALAGRVQITGAGMWDVATIEAVPKEPGLPTRTCRSQSSFRFIGLAPGTYSLRIHAREYQTQVVDNVIVRSGQVTWLDPITLQRALPNRNITR